MIYLKKYDNENDFGSDFDARMLSADVMLEVPNVSLIGNHVNYMPIPMRTYTYYRIDGFGLEGGSDTDIQNLIDAAAVFDTHIGSSEWDYIKFFLKATSRCVSVTTHTCTIFVSSYSAITALWSAYVDMDSNGTLGTITNFNRGTNMGQVKVHYAYTGEIEFEVYYTGSITDSNLPRYFNPTYPLVNIPVTFNRIKTFLTSITETGTVTSDPIMIPCFSFANETDMRDEALGNCKTMYSWMAEVAVEMETAGEHSAQLVSFGGYPTASGLSPLPWPERVAPSSVTEYSLQALATPQSSPSWSKLTEFVGYANGYGASQANQVMLMILTWCAKNGYTSNSLPFYGGNDQVNAMNQTATDMDTDGYTAAVPNGEFTFGSATTAPTTIAPITETITTTYTNIYTLETAYSKSHSDSVNEGKFNPFDFLRRVLVYCTGMVDTDIVSLFNMFIDTQRAESTYSITWTTSGLDHAINTALTEMDECGVDVSGINSSIWPEQQ